MFREARGYFDAANPSDGGTKNASNNGIVNDEVKQSKTLFSQRS